VSNQRSTCQDEDSVIHFSGTDNAEDTEDTEDTEELNKLAEKQSENIWRRPLREMAVSTRTKPSVYLHLFGVNPAGYFS